MQKEDSAFRRPLEFALRHALAHLENLDGLPVAATASLETLRSRLGTALTDDGLDAEQVITDLVQNVAGGIVGSAGGRFFGWVVGGLLPAALAADWLTAAWDQNAGIYVSGPAAAVVEEVAGGWLKEILGLPAGASFALVTGCQMAHATCLAAARHALLDRTGWDVEQQGLYGAPPIRLLTSTERHGTIDRAVRFLGLGRAQVIDLPADAHGRLQPDVRERALEVNASTPTIVLLQAGDLNIGAYDPFDTLISIARRHAAWVHVDGAFGLWVAASARYRHLVQWVVGADSWATDGHKWLNVPYDCGYAFCAHPDAHAAAMSLTAAYLTGQGQGGLRAPSDYVLESSRRARGFATWAALRQLGRTGVAELIERCCG